MSTDQLAHIVGAFERIAVRSPFAPPSEATNSARPSIADTVRHTVELYGFDRRQWPAELLAAAAPYDALAQLALGKAQRVNDPPPRSAWHPPAHVRTHRPHATNTGDDWRPVIPGNDLAIPNFGRE